MSKKESSEDRQKKMKFVILWVKPQRKRDSQNTRTPEGAYVMPDSPEETKAQPPRKEDKNGQA
jgi:hypothetical protein